MTMHEDVWAHLRAWVDAGWLREVDEAFSRFLAREAAQHAQASAEPPEQRGRDAPHPRLLLAAALASHQLGRGHACLDLRALLRHPQGTLGWPPDMDERASQMPAVAVPLPEGLLATADLPTWITDLQDPLLVGSGEGNTPLVLQDDRLYLRRWWRHEGTVRNGLRARLAAPAPVTGEDVLEACLDVLFEGGDGAFDWQRAACAVAAGSRVAIVTGGPGTGKTTTVVKLLATLQALAMADASAAQPLRIRLAAPTGKAAARLSESIGRAVGDLPLDALPQAQGRVDALRRAIPTQVATVHRLLGTRPDSRRFRHDRTHPLALDVLVLDEASMVDLELMASVMDALPPHARLVLLGDKDQLASVEAGAVLGALCQRADEGHYTPATRERLQAITGQRIDERFVDANGTAMDQAVVKLRRSWRFDAGSGIGRLAAAVNAGDVQQAREVLQGGGGEVAWIEAATGAAADGLMLDGRSPAFAGHAAYLERLQGSRPQPGVDRTAADAWARSLLEAYTRFQVLCALRHGPAGVAGLNRRIEDLLRARGLIEAGGPWYAGRPVMVMRNDAGLGLMNGDVGLALPYLPDTQHEGAPPLRVAFASIEAPNGVRWISPSRLPAVETVYAMTVHKSQGSEFEHAALVLPATASRVLTRELVYTAVTRARRGFTLLGAGEGDVLREALERRVERAGGPLM